MPWLRQGQYVWSNWVMLGSTPCHNVLGAPPSLTQRLVASLQIPNCPNSKFHRDDLLLKTPLPCRFIFTLFSNIVFAAHQSPHKRNYTFCSLPGIYAPFIQPWIIFILSLLSRHKVRFIMASEGGCENCVGWAARDPSGVLSPYKFNRRLPSENDISIKITHCGVCYADVIWTRNGHGDSKYLLVPGHEIVGIVTEVGSAVVGFKVNDHAGVGTIVYSCQDCKYCTERKESLCEKGKIFTFNNVDVDGSITKGGYSSHIVAHQRYCFKIPENLPLAHAAPLLCAGITVYTPMIRHHMNQAGRSLGVIGLGGLGQMAVKFGKAFGLTVTVFSTSAAKEDEALKILGADKFLLSSDPQKMKAESKTLDFIIDTASGDHPIDSYMPLLKTEGVFAIVGFPSEIKVHPANLNIGAKMIAGSVTGGAKDIQEMIYFCAREGIHPQIEVIPIHKINEALERMINRDVKYRFVIDIENSLASE